MDSFCLFYIPRAPQLFFGSFITVTETDFKECQAQETFCFVKNFAQASSPSLGFLSSGISHGLSCGPLGKEHDSCSREMLIVPCNSQLPLMSSGPSVQRLGGELGSQPVTEARLQYSPGPSALQKKISKKTESIEASKAFKRKKSTVSVHRHTASLRGRAAEAHPLGSLDHLYGAFLLVFLWPITLFCLIQSPYLIYLKILPGRHTQLLAEMNSMAKAYG